MTRIVECVPNFSEGRDLTIVNAIGESVRSVGGVKLLSVEPDKDYNRSVVTFVGEPAAVEEAAFRATKTAAERIDMTRHKGEHPRLGAADVVPFIPVTGVEMTECVAIANRFGKRVASELHIPVYLYEEAATRPERKDLSAIRKGEYEGLPEKLKLEQWRPDYGLPEFNARSGATVTGARVFLIAYNVNLTTDRKEMAQEIAVRIRESGRLMKDSSGKSFRVSGSLKSVKAMGVYLERFGIAQVSINLTNYLVTPPHTAFEEVRREAQKLGINVTGSEVVGLIPLEALLMAGRFYWREEASRKSEEELLARAIETLGLSQLEAFVPTSKIIEYMI